MRALPLTYHELIKANNCMRLVTSDDVLTITKIEEDSFPEDEKASYEKILMRSQVARNYFYILTNSAVKDASNMSCNSSEEEIIGYINGTCILESHITHEAMETHHATGTTLVLHSVTMKSNYRRQGLATFMLKSYLNFMKNEFQIQSILLLCKGNLCKFYRNCGFDIVGISSVVHGQDPWFEMSFDIARSRLLSQYQVDSFTSEGFCGNPAGVVLGMRSTEWMQNMGMENNLAETSFIRPDLTSKEPKNVATYDLRWFTPAIEVALCGHATLAAAHVLFEYHYLNNPSTPAGQTVDTICFNTLYRGQLRAKQIIKDEGKFIELDFPSQPPSPSHFTEMELASLCSGLCLDSSELLYSGRSVDDVFLVVSPEVFARIPSLASGSLNITALGTVDARGIIVTCVGPNSSSDSPFTDRFPKADFLSRFFAPRVGIAEDPVTGSAHTVLAPYWCEKLGKTSLMGYQHSQRGGWVGVRQDMDRIYLTGQCVSMKESTILVDE